METRILTQALEIAASLALGVILGFIYDLFRLPRGLFRPLAWLFDLGFCLIMAAGLFVLGMACGGTLRYYMPFAAALAAAAYSALFGRWLRPLLAAAEGFGRKKLNALKMLVKKMSKNLKNIFSRAKKRFRMIEYTENDKVGKIMGISLPRRRRRKGESHEVSQTGDSKNYYPGSADLRPFHAGGGHGKAGGGRGAAS